jgi:hypothetical protein
MAFEESEHKVVKATTHLAPSVNTCTCRNWLFEVGEWAGICYHTDKTNRIADSSWSLPQFSQLGTHLKMIGAQTHNPKVGGSNPACNLIHYGSHGDHNATTNRSNPQSHQILLDMRQGRFAGEL